MTGEHISAYSLIFEEGTYLKTLLDSGKVCQADEDVEAQMYEYTMKYLTENGFEQYEISNYAKPGFECRHNLKYWTHEEYIGFGPSAASFIGEYRYVNVRDINKYIDPAKRGTGTIDTIERIDSKTSMDEFIFLGLRSKGINMKSFEERFDKNFLAHYGNSVKRLLENKLAYLNTEYFSLTPRGYAVCDEIVVSYF